uniref:Uncharacterized protein n=1 Tax=Cucumis melo TaxID=3656 RepID=A0A9I9CFY4_CUCME
MAQTERLKGVLLPCAVGAANGEKCTVERGGDRRVRERESDGVKREGEVVRKGKGK